MVSLLAVAAPFIASSHPILMKSGGKWSSPMWTYLTMVDLVLVAGTFALLGVLLYRKMKLSVALTILVGVVALAVPLASLKHTPDEPSYETYRNMERAGQVEAIYRTIIPYSPTDRLRDHPESRLTSPSRTHWLGTEVDGADLLSRMIHASRIALSIGLLSTSISILIGVIVGGVMGYFVGWVDLIGMRLVEIFEAIPTLLVLITVMTLYERNIYRMMIVIGLLSWTGTARYVRAEFLRLRQQDFVQAAIATGVTTPFIIFKHILPNGLTPVLVTATFGVASAILLEATLSFLGLGLIDQPSWGQMLNKAREGGQGFVWWMALFPGLAIFLTVFAYALIGDAMRDALDPKLKKRE